MDIAKENESLEVVEFLMEVDGKEIPDKVKLQQLSKAMYSEDTKKFSELLTSLTPELVIFCQNIYVLWPYWILSGEHHSCQ